MDGTKDGHLDFESINPLFDMLLLMSTQPSGADTPMSLSEIRRVSLADPPGHEVDAKEVKMRRVSTTIEENDGEEGDAENAEDADAEAKQGESGEMPQASSSVLTNPSGRADASSDKPKTAQLEIDKSVDAKEADLGSAMVMCTGMRQSYQTTRSNRLSQTEVAEAA